MTDPTQQAGRCRILRELGVGGTAIVYLAVDEAPCGFAKLVVLKKLRRELVDEPEILTMFREEARLAARLNHPNVVQTNGTFEENGDHFIVMEYLEGEPLSAVRLESERAGSEHAPLTPIVHLRILSEALAGLAYAHEATDFDGTPLGLVHRDMSPHNVFVGFDGHVKILDFGIARSATRSRKTETGVVKGKFRYMAPEQLEGADVDARADIFSMGIMLWEAATGLSMWGQLTDAQVMARLVTEDPSVTMRGEGLPPSLERLCRKALARDRSVRHASCRELQEELALVIAEIEEAETSARASVAATMDSLFGEKRVRRRSEIAAEMIGNGDAPRNDREPSIRIARREGSTEDSHVPIAVDARAARPRRRLATAFLATVCAISGAGIVSADWGPPKGKPRSPSSATVVAATFESRARPRASAEPESDLAAPRSVASVEPTRRAPSMGIVPNDRGALAPAVTAPDAAVSTRKTNSSAGELDRENPWR